SEKEHGADVYSTDMVLTPSGDGFTLYDLVGLPPPPGRHAPGLRLLRDLHPERYPPVRAR
ncbi:hypothetical protein AB0G02_33300, partial [Actinosynnema sp. NPDC023658]|uniref:hypothetical protein n=1 Tax=Actinosynnema sp. NPDC023658 TaxID=3155465 RepID=UPI0033E0F80C